MKEIIFRITKEEMKRFLDISKELVKINNDFKIIFLPDGILFYTIEGEDNGKINVLKSFSFKHGELFSEMPKNLPLNITFMDGKKFHDKMNFLLESEEITITIHYNNDFLGYNFGGKNDLLEVRAICQTNNRIKDLTFNIINERLNSDYAEWSFEMTNEQLTKVLKMSKLDTSNELLTIRIDNGDIYFSESQWDLKVGTSQTLQTGNWNLKKEYLKYIINDSNKDSFTFSIFPTYIVIDENKSHLMFSMDLID